MIWWVPLALGSAVLLGLYDIAKKHALNGNAVLPVLFGATFCGSVPFIAFLAAGKISHSFDVWAHVLFAAKAVLVSSSWIMAFFALKHLPITIVTPIRSSAPAWTLCAAMLLFGERLVALQWLGVGLVFAAFVLMALLGKREDIHFLKNRWIWCILGATLTGSASAIYDKYLLLRYPPLPMQCWFYFYLVLVLGLCVALIWWPSRLRHTRFAWRWSIPAIGLLLAASDYFYFHAIAEPGAMISLISILRRSSVVVAFTVGAWVFGDRFVRQKARAVLLIVLGITAIALGTALRH